VVGGDDGAGDGQADDGAAVGSGPGGVEAVEPAEDSVQIGGGDAVAGVGDLDDGVGAVAAGADPDRPARRGVA
jgi:hypothetical protein